MKISLPWGRQQDADDAGNPADDNAGYYDDGQEPEGEGDGEDALADFDADQRAAVEAYAEQARQQERQSLRAPLQSAGLDVVDGKLVGDPQKFQSWVQPQTPPAAPPAAPAAPQQPEDEPWPDAYSDPDAFKARMRAEIQREAQALVKQQTDQQAGTFAAMQTTMLEDAIRNVPQAIKEQAPYLEQWLRHPDMERALREQLPRTDPLSWRDPKFLASLVGALAPQLGPAPPAEKPRQSDGRYAPVQNQQRPAGRVPLGQLGASPTGGRAPEAQQYSDVDKMVAERLRISPERARAAADPTGQELREVRAKERDRARSGGRR